MTGEWFDAFSEGQRSQGARLIAVQETAGAVQSELPELKSGLVDVIGRIVTGEASDTRRQIHEFEQRAVQARAEEHQEVTEVLGAGFGEVRQELAGVRADAKARGTELGQKIDRATGAVDACVDLVGEIPGQVQGDVGRAVEAVNRAGERGVQSADAALSAIQETGTALLTVCRESVQLTEEGVRGLEDRMRTLEEARTPRLVASSAG